MKKAIAAVFALALAASSASASVGVDFGTNWYKVSYTDNVGDHLFGQGQNFLVFWQLDNGLTLGSYTEAGVWTYDGGSSDTWDLTAIQIGREIVKNVAIATHIGRIYDDYSGNDHMLVDIFADVTLVGGTSDKVSGAVKFSLGGRYAKDQVSTYDMSGITAGLSVGLEF